MMPPASLAPPPSDLDGQAWVVHCDGSALPNPGRMGMGAVMVGPDGTRHTISQATHSTGCNNEAELRALMAALRELRSRGARALKVYSDSSILVAQLGGIDSPPIVRLAAVVDEARALLASFEQASVQWIPRHRNGEADELARAALGLPAKVSKKPGQRG